MLPFGARSLRENVDRLGGRPFANWFQDLNAQAAAKVTTALIRIEQGNFSNAKGVGSGVYETRIDFGPGYRVYFGKHGATLLILLGGGTKNRQQNDALRPRRNVGATTTSARHHRRKIMALTRDFKQTVQDRIAKDPAYRNALLREGVECMLSGDLEAGKSILRDYINATIGFEKLADVTHRPPKSLMRMFSARGNPQARNLFEVIGHLRKAEGLHFELSLKR